MKNLQKLTKRNLKQINGNGNDYICPDFIITTCAEWCRLSSWQQQYCLNAIEEAFPCNC
ncbi:bacteriocin-like protein [Chryseobacterium pennipullorum]|uniref:bacteriocin-like protein n=1 Tax=Chryseobacterium pennipullorum TaxID=2258963 RepID=UPI001403FB55|nr:hypothetical protein [Chryseobacterium pennipullorum]